MAWVAIRRAARSATPPNTPRAMAIGLSARSAFAATGAVAWNVDCTPTGMNPGELRLHQATSLASVVHLDPVRSPRP